MQGHCRETKKKIGALAHFNSDSCREKDYSLTIIKQAKDYKTLKRLEGFYQRKFPECFDWGNQRMEGRNIRKKKARLDNHEDEDYQDEEDEAEEDG